QALAVVANAAGKSLAKLRDGETESSEERMKRHADIETGGREILNVLDEIGEGDVDDAAFAEWCRDELARRGAVVVYAQHLQRSIAAALRRKARPQLVGSET